MLLQSLVRPAPAISPKELGCEVARLFEADRSLSAIAVVRDHRPVGLIDRLGFMSRFATRYGRDLYANKPIARMMERDPLVIDCSNSIEAASVQLFRQKPSALQTGFIVADREVYVGIVTGLDLLQALTGSLATSNRQLHEARDTLVQSEKMAALGALVAGVAHEVNTPIGSALTAATAFSQRAQSFAATAGGGVLRRSDVERFVAGALEAAEHVQANIGRASELITSFKQIAVDQTSDQRRHFALARCLEDVLVTLQPQMRKASVGCTLSCPADLELEGYPGTVSQILSNLLMNALIHAFPGRSDGTIAVAVARAPGPPVADGPAAEGPADGEWVRLSVSDNGCGIPPEIRPRVFDPFFTTRRGSGGSGLGLHIVYNLLTQRLGGRITVEDGEAGGTRFVLSFPAIAPRDAGPVGPVG